MSGLDVAARGLARRALEVDRELGSARGAALVGFGPGSVEDALAGVINPLMMPGDTFAQKLAAAVTAAKGFAETKVNHNPDAIHGYVALPPGDYSAEDFISLTTDHSTFANLVLVAVPGTVRINIAPGTYLFEATAYTNRLHFEGVVFVGGKGVLRRRFAAANIAGFHTFRNCVFTGYTECAVVSEVSDQPYWRFTQCQFWGAAGSDTRGIALSGLVDDLVIEGCAFNRNQYHIVLDDLRSGGSIRNNSFLSFTDNHTDADIVIAPNKATSAGSNSGFGLHICENKFGNEGLNESAPRILFAALNNDGDGIENHTVSTSWITSSQGTNQLRGITIARNAFSANGANDAPVVRSYVDRIARVLIVDNAFQGGTWTYLVEWMGDHALDYSLSWDVRLGEYSKAGAGSAPPFTLGLSNKAMGPMCADLPHAEAMAPYAPLGGIESSLIHCATAADWSVASGASKASAIGPRGAADATEVTVASAAGTPLYRQFSVAADNLDRTVWVTVRLKRHATQSVSRVRIWIRNAANTRSMHLGDYTLPQKWGQVCFPATLPNTASAANWQVIFVPLDYAAATGDKFLVGPMHVNVGPAPMAAPPAAHATAATASYAAPSGGATQDAEARAAIAQLAADNAQLRSRLNTLLVQAQRFGLMLPA